MKIHWRVGARSFSQVLYNTSREQKEIRIPKGMYPQHQELICILTADNVKEAREDYNNT